jgi:hypothetical protein
MKNQKKADTMNNRSQKLLWFGLIIAVILGITWQFVPLSDAQNRVHALPLFGKDFIGENVPTTPFEKSFFQNVDILKRIYTIGQNKYFIFVLDGTHNRHTVHDPYYCFRGIGFTIDSEKLIPIKGGYAKLIQVSKDSEHREALFWFSDGTSHYTSSLRYWWLSTLRRLTLGFSGPESVLISVQPVDEETIDWDKFKKEFPQIFEL